MKKTILIWLCSVWLSPLLVMAQPLRSGEWRTYTAMNVVTDVALTSDSSAAWVATNGGAFRVTLADPKPESILALRKSDGLSDIKVTATGTDVDGNAYFGGETGTIDIYTEATKKMHSVSDITLSSLITKKTINNFSVFGDNVYISANFGLSIYNRRSGSFIITVPKFGSLVAEDTAFAAMEYNGKIYVVLTDAIAVADKNSVNLSAPFAWTTSPAPPGTYLRSLALYKGKVYVSGSGGLYEVSQSLALNPIAIDTEKVNGIKLVATDSLYILDATNGGRLISTSNLQNFTFQSIPSRTSSSDIKTFAVTKKRDIIYGSANDGVSTVNTNNTITSDVFPAGPLSNSISSLSFAPSNGKLYISHGVQGISVFDAENSLWLSLGTVNNSPLPRTNYTFLFFDSTRNALWASTFGNGLGKISFNGNTISSSFRKNSAGLQYTAGGNVDFIVVGQCILDNKSNLVCPTWALNGEGLHISKDGDQFTSYQMNTPDGLYRPFGAIAQDFDGYYYLATIENSFPIPYGVVYRSLDGSVSGGLPGTGSNATLLNAIVNALIVDQDNGLWCGTNAGVNIVSHSKSFSTGSVEFRARKIPYLEEQVVRTIAVDGVGNKWVGTDRGIFVVSPDGSDSVARYTSENSPLIDNNVLSISFDTKTGEAYIATGKGISRTSSIFKEGNSDYTKMVVFPNPVTQGTYDDIKMTITGLVSGSTVKIYSVSGRLIKTIDGSQLGSTVSWDGHDENGMLPESGIYIVSATSVLAKESGQSKFVLVRKN